LNSFQITAEYYQEYTKGQQEQSFEFQIFSDKLAAFTTVLSFLAFCVLPLVPFLCLGIQRIAGQGAVVSAAIM
jgi:hypothetical protein